MIKGVAGSGKTLMLLKHAKLIRQRHPRCRVLLTCFNRVLARVLELRVADPTNVTVRNIDRLPFYLENERRQPGQPLWFNRDGNFDKRIEFCVNYLREHPDARMFDIVLVDQEEDFDPLRLKFAYSLLKPGRKDFIVARDAAQNVYGRPGWLPPGSSGRGRTTILRTNYCNTQEVLYPAFDLLMMGDDNRARSGDPEINDVIIEPAKHLRHGPTPEILNVGRGSEVNEVCNMVSELDRKGARWDEIAVLCGNYEIQTEYETQMQRRGIPCLNLPERDQWSRRAQRDRDRAAETPDHVLIASLTILKGLQFQHVFLSGLEEVRAKEDDDTTIRRFLYVAMTRSTRHLTIMANDQEPYLRDIQRLIQ